MSTTTTATATEVVAEDQLKKPKMSKLRFIIIAVLSVAFLLFQLYIGMYKPLPALISTPIHLCLALAIVFFL